MLMPAAIAAKKKRWALVYPNFEYGQSAAENFKALMKKAQPDVEFVTEQAPPLGKIDAGAVAQAIDDAKPDAIFNVAVRRRPRQVRARGQHPRRVQGSHGGRACCPASRNISIRSRTRRRSAGSSPAIPGTRSRRKEHKAFLAAYQKKYNDYPRLGSIVGYVDHEVDRRRHRQGRSRPTPRSWSTAFKGLKVDSPVRPIQLPGERPPGHDGRLSSARSRWRTARAPWSTSNMSTAPRCCRPTPRSRSCGRRGLSCASCFPLPWGEGGERDDSEREPDSEADLSRLAPEVARPLSRKRGEVGRP